MSCITRVLKLRSGGTQYGHRCAEVSSISSFSVMPKEGEILANIAQQANRIMDLNEE
jgi:hypothetical protein